MTDMLKWYRVLRIAGYSAGGLGLVLILTGRQGVFLPYSMAAGVILLIGMACAFLGTYVIFMVSRPGRRGS